MSSITCQNAAGESFVVTNFNYFVSNFQLQKADGTQYVLSWGNTYYLVQKDKPDTQTVTLGNIPASDYTNLSFVVGVDSLRSLVDISRRKRVLDPSLGTYEAMYREWNTGYIFLELEGTSSAAPATQNNFFSIVLADWSRLQVKENT